MKSLVKRFLPRQRNRSNYEKLN